MIKKQSIERLEEIADFHLDLPDWHKVDTKVQFYDLQKMIGFVEGPNVLEMGYGDGMWTKKIIELFGHTHVLDASSKLLTTVKEKFGDKVTCYESFFEEFLPVEKKFNTVIASHVLEHVYDTVAVLKNARNWLEKDGQIIIIVPNAQSLHRELAVLMGLQKTIYDFSESDSHVGHVRVYDINLLREHVLSAGFRITHERGLFLKTLPNFMMTGFSDEILKASVEISDRLPAHLMANIAMIIEVDD